MKYPRIYLAADNCFAIKRWVKPREWMRLCRDMGITYIQASCDNEIDPLYNPGQYRVEWLKQVRECEKELGVKVVNFYTGYQTYRTVGLASDDERVIRNLTSGWFLPMIDLAAELSAGLGFYMAALVDEVLQDPERYALKMEQITDGLAQIAVMAKEKNVIVGMEQMYNPASPPWTIDGTVQMLKDVYEKGGAPFYTTIDVGHMIGQRKFVKRDRGALITALERAEKLYVGAEQTRRRYDKAISDGLNAEETALEIEAEMLLHPYLFSRTEDGDPYAWLAEVGCYSPIVHLQQTDGKSSHHAAFTQEQNEAGIIAGDKVLRAIARSYEKEQPEGMPPKAEDIYLSFEIFAANTETRHEVLDKMQKSVEYWRRFIPKDGLSLEELVCSTG